MNLSETKVDIVGLCQEGQFLVAGERSGNLHLIHVSSKQTLLTKARCLFLAHSCENVTSCI